MTLLFTIYLVSAILCAVGIAQATRAYASDEYCIKGRHFSVGHMQDVQFGVFLATAPVVNTIFIYFIWADALVGENHWLNRVLYRLFTGKRWKR